MKNQKKIKILEVTAFSAGICGVWTRVFGEASRLAKKYDVHVFSSDIFRGDSTIKAKHYEEIENIKITRFSTKASFGDNTFFWNYKKEALKLNPDIIIVHAYRQYYSTMALKIAKKLKIPCFLVTHAPFLNRDLRSWKLNLMVSVYDTFIGRIILNKYTKIIAISKWEIPYLLKLGAKMEKIIYIPNGVPEEFFKNRVQEKSDKKKILFFGRVSPIKDLETLIRAMSLLKNNDIKLDIIGTYEEGYKKELINLIAKMNLGNKINFLPPVYGNLNKINLFDKYSIFILPSRREALPTALIEAMARGKIVISSLTDGGKELIEDGKNGFLFEIGDGKELARIIDSINNINKNKIIEISSNARKSSEKFSWNRLIGVIDSLIIENINL